MMGNFNPADIGYRVRRLRGPKRQGGSWLTLQNHLGIGRFLEDNEVWIDGSNRVGETGLAPTPAKPNVIAEQFHDTVSETGAEAVSRSKK